MSSKVTPNAKTKVATTFRERWNIKWSPAYLFLLPWIFGILVFRLYPFINAFRISMLSQRIGMPDAFVGFANFNEILFGTTMHGNLFRQSLGITFRYVAMTVPLVLVVALFVAFILNFKVRGIGFFRTAFYIPSILGGSVSVALLWRAVFGNQGLINSFIGVFGIAPVGWMVQGSTALIVMSLLRAWQFGSVMLIFLSALQNVPASLYEAASIDGARKFRQFLTVTIPIITPTILFNIINLLVASFQEFNAPFLVPAQPGGPVNATLLLNLFIYDRAFVMNNFGIAGAASWIMFVIIMAFTGLLIRFSDRWVFYND